TWRDATAEEPRGKPVGGRRWSVAVRARPACNPCRASPTVTVSASGRTRSIASQLLGIAAIIEIKSVINVALAADGLVIVVALSRRQALEPFGDGLETGRFGRQVGSPGIGAAHDHRHPFDGLVLDLVFPHDGVERAFLAVMTKLRAGRVIGDGGGLAPDAVDLVDRDEQELGLRIDERANEPGACDPVYLHIGPCYPFHGSLHFRCI